MSVLLGVIIGVIVGALVLGGLILYLMVKYGENMFNG